MFDSPDRLFLGLLIGIVFGVLLQKGRVAKFSVIVGQFILKDWTVVRDVTHAGDGGVDEPDEGDEPDEEDDQERSGGTDGADAESLAPEEEGAATEHRHDEVRDDRGRLVGAAASPLDAMERAGREFGDLVHRILEHADVAGPDPAGALAASVARQPASPPLSEREATMLADGLLLAVMTPLGPQATDPTLAGLPAGTPRGPQLHGSAGTTRELSVRASWHRPEHRRPPDREVGSRTNPL
jgi:hypothetical protein